MTIKTHFHPNGELVGLRVNEVLNMVLNGFKKRTVTTIDTHKRRGGEEERGE
jgi:hypothetical protein